MTETAVPIGATAAPEAIVDTMFRRLFENEFATLDGIAISHRTAAGIVFIDESVALGRMLAIESAFAPFEPADPGVRRLHEAFLDAWPEASAVVSGWSRHLRALLDEAMALPPATSMLRKRGITDFAEHLVDPEELVDPALPRALDAAAARAETNGMAHRLLLASDGYVVVAAPDPIEAMAHWHNIEFAASVECMRVEEIDVHGA